MPQMSGGDAVVQALIAHGIKSVYCLPGIQSDHLFNALFDVGDALSVIHTRHEQAAIDYAAAKGALVVVAAGNEGIDERITGVLEHGFQQPCVEGVREGELQLQRDPRALVGDVLKEPLPVQVLEGP